MCIDKLRANPSRNTQCQQEWQSLANPWIKMMQAKKSYGGAIDPRLNDFHWQLEEPWMALYAQKLKTPNPMSSKQLQKILDSLRK